MRLPEIHRYGQVFNFVADNIHCWADAEGAQVWEVKFDQEENPYRSCKVLAHREDDAEGIAQDWEDTHFAFDEDDEPDEEEED